MLQPGKSNLPPLTRLSDYLNKFHLGENGYQTLRSADYVSEPTIGSSPIGLKWYEFTLGFNNVPILEEMNKLLMCSDCTYSDGNSGCSSTDYGQRGTCNFTTRECMCKDSYSGGRCHLPPVKGSISMVSQLDPENSLCMHCGDSNFHLDASKTSVDLADMIRLSFHEGEEEVHIVSLREVE